MPRRNARLITFILPHPGPRYKTENAECVYFNEPPEAAGIVLLRLANFPCGRRCALVKIGALLRVAVAQICGADRSPLAYLDGCPCSASPFSAAGSGSAPQPSTPRCICRRQHFGVLAPGLRARPGGALCPDCSFFCCAAGSMGQRFEPPAGAGAWSVFIFDLNPPTALLTEFPLPLRGIPPSGGMSHRRLLLIAGCAAAAKALRLKISANPKEEGAVRGPEPPYGGGGAAAGEPIKGWRVGIDDKS